MKAAGERWCTTCKNWGQDPQTNKPWTDGKTWLRTKYCAACPTEKSASKARRMVDSPSHVSHNAAQKRRAKEMAGKEERFRCRTCEHLLPREKFSTSQLHDSSALERRCRECARRFDSKAQQKHNLDAGLKCAKCDKPVSAHATHISDKQKINARNARTKILCLECVNNGFTALNLNQYTCSINTCQYGRNAFVTEEGEEHTKTSFNNAQRRGKLVCKFCHVAGKT
jgi:hypothetical protein